MAARSIWNGTVAFGLISVPVKLHTATESKTVHFREVTGVLDQAVEHGWTLAIGAADLDGDLLPEIYFGHDFGPDRLLHNRSTPGHFRTENRSDPPRQCRLGETECGHR